MNVLTTLIFGTRDVTLSSGNVTSGLTFANGSAYNLGQFNLQKTSSYQKRHKLFYSEWLWGGRYDTYELVSGLYIKSWAESNVWQGQILYKMKPPYTYNGITTNYGIMNINGDNVPAMQGRRWSISKEYCFLPDPTGTSMPLIFNMDVNYSLSDTLTYPVGFINFGGNIAFGFRFNRKSSGGYTASVYYV